MPPGTLPETNWATPRMSAPTPSVTMSNDMSGCPTRCRNTSELKRKANTNMPTQAVAEESGEHLPLAERKVDYP